MPEYHPSTWHEFQANAFSGYVDDNLLSTPSLPDTNPKSSNVAQDLSSRKTAATTKTPGDVGRCVKGAARDPVDTTINIMPNLVPLLSPPKTKIIDQGRIIRGEELFTEGGADNPPLPSPPKTKIINQGPIIGGEELFTEGGADNPPTMATCSPVRLGPHEMRNIMGGVDVAPAPLFGGADEHVLHGMSPEELSLLQDAFPPPPARAEDGR